MVTKSDISSQNKTKRIFRADWGGLISCVAWRHSFVILTPDILCLSSYPSSFTFKQAHYCPSLSQTQTYTQTHRMPAGEMIASQYELAEGIYSMLDQCEEITVLNRDKCLLKTLLLWVFQHQEMLNTPSLLIYSPLCSSSCHTQETSSRAGSPLFFTRLNALIKPSDHLGRDKEVMASASLKHAASALCSTISCHRSTVTGYLTNVALCHCMDDKCSISLEQTGVSHALQEKKKKKR